ncbi:MAG: hypothetical protein HOP19_00790, partial [Acidobacteria bacterium]|nr:hypothetical protein [Acidobacteriota bacterium]
TGSFNVTAGAGCTWTATSNQAWLTITGSASGTSNGTVNYAVAVNAGAGRSAVISVGGQTFTVTQAGGCAFTLSATSANVAATASNGSFNVTSSAGCQWAATSNQSWLTITSGASGSGNGTVNYSVAANTGTGRSAVITAGGQSFTVTQASGCTYALSATSANVAASSGNQSVNVTSGAGCTWAAASNATWLTVTSGATGNGNGAVNYSVTANGGAQRTGTLTIAGQTYTVTQASGCTYALSSASGTVTAAGNNSSFSVTSGAGCAWTATSNANWLAIMSGASGSGNGTVVFTAAANNGAARSATITAAGLTFTVMQAGGCVYNATISGQTFSSQATLGTVAITTTAGCAWTAGSNQSWLALTTASSGSGNGTVGFALSPNLSGAARQATLTAAGRSFVISQDATCGVALPNEVVNVAAVAGTGVASVTTNPQGCVFTATSNADWLVISGKTGSAVNYNIAANTGAARTGTLMIGDKTYTVNQAAAAVGCSAYYTPTSHNASYAGGSYSVTVSSGNDCRWTATTATPWIMLDAGTAIGVRRGVVNYALATNTTTQTRTGTIQVLGQTFTITQAAAPACNFSVSPGTLNVPASGGNASIAVTAGTSCSWSATSDSVAQVTQGIYGSGNGTVGFMTQPNTAASSRTFKVMVAGQNVTVTQAGSATSNPLPTASRVYPDALTIGAARTLTVYGRNFLANSVVRWNGVDRVTTFVSENELRATLPATDLETADLGTAKVTVSNPPSASNAGGGLSSALDCRVVRKMASVSAASYGVNGDASVTPDSIVAGFGSDLAITTAVGNTLPLPTTLGGTSVRLYDSAGRSFLAPLFFVSPTQVNYLIPADLTPGLAEIIITGSNGRMEIGTLQINNVNPGLFAFNAAGQGVVAGQVLRARNGAVTYEELARFDGVTSQIVATPIDLGPATDQVFLILYGTGLRKRSDLRNVQCFIGGQTAGAGTEVSVLYLGAQGGFVGLDQVNLQLPRSLAGSGLVKL